MAKKKINVKIEELEKGSEENKELEELKKENERLVSEVEIFDKIENDFRINNVTGLPEPIKRKKAGNVEKASSESISTFVNFLDDKATKFTHNENVAFSLLMKDPLFGESATNIFLNKKFEDGWIVTQLSKFWEGFCKIFGYNYYSKQYKKMFQYQNR